MRLPVDDEIYQVNGVWLGPPGKTLPWRARYVAYAVGVVIFVVLQAIERRLGIGLGFFSVAYSLLVTVGLTRLVLKVVDHDRSVGSVVTAFAHEVGAPREDLRERRFTFHPRRITAVTFAKPHDGRDSERLARRQDIRGGHR